MFDFGWELYGRLGVQYFSGKCCCRDVPGARSLEEFVHTRLHADDGSGQTVIYRNYQCSDVCLFRLKAVRLHLEPRALLLVGHTSVRTHGVLSWTPSGTRIPERVDLTPSFGAGAPQDHSFT